MARRQQARALPYEKSAHSYRLTAARLAQSKINMLFFPISRLQTDAIASSAYPELSHADTDQAAGRQLAALLAYQRVMIEAHDPGT